MAKKKRGPITDPIVFAKLVLRGASLRWYARNQALVNQRVDRGIYMCKICQGLFKKDQLQADHIKPVVDIKNGDEGLEEWVRRLFVPVEQWQWICQYSLPDGTQAGCHAVKTEHENQLRQFYKKQKKNVAKKKPKE